VQLGLIAYSERPHARRLEARHPGRGVFNAETPSGYRCEFLRGGEKNVRRRLALRDT
jgi:hypothetical protein